MVLGRQMKKSFQRMGGLNLTTQLMRALMSTECYDLALDDKITAREKGMLLMSALDFKCNTDAVEAVNNVNGHTSYVVKDYYIMKDREAGNIFLLAIFTVYTNTYIT
jgi:hypothetical protein